MKDLEDQKELVNRLDWKFLFVLDACRYDNFRKQCGFEGELQKVRSPAFEGEGAPTSVWYRNVFDKKYDDVIHISSHPRVNSRMEVEGFKGFEHFGEVIDLWDSEWNDEFGTVLAEDVTSKARELIKKKPEKKFVLHYMQPHTPYLSLGPPTTKKKRDPESRGALSRKFRNTVVAGARNFIGDKRAVDMMSLLGLPPLSPMDDALRKVGEDGVREAYRKNLEIVLKSLESIVELIGTEEEKAVITADHGEVLGEGGRFGHDLSSRPILTDVPWFVLR